MEKASKIAARIFLFSLMGLCSSYLFFDSLFFNGFISILVISFLIAGLPAAAEALKKEVKIPNKVLDGNFKVQGFASVEVIDFAIKAGEILVIKYHAGSTPGEIREIFPVSRKENGIVMARCLRSKRIKSFKLDLIEVMIEEDAA